MAVSVLSLPTEVICSVFRYVSEADPCSCSRERAHLGWLVPVTHTCATWRRAALGFAELWGANLCSFSSSEVTEHFLERAGNFAPLVFATRLPWAPAPPPLTEYQMLLAKRNLHRIKIFKQNKDDLVSKSFAEALQTAFLPRLTILHINRWPRAGESYVITDFCLDAPALEELHIDSVFFKLNAPRLRVLQATNTTRPEDRVCVSDQMILDTLRATPLLEQLTLGEMFSSSAEHPTFQGDVDPSALIDLPHLRSVHLKEFGLNPVFYQYINAAPDADVSVEDMECDAAHTIPYLLAAMADHLRVRAYDTLYVSEEPKRGEHGHGHERMHLHLSLSSSSAKPMRGSWWSARFKLEARVILDMDATLSALGLLKELLVHIDARNIRELNLGGIDGVSYGQRGEMRETLARFEGVSTAVFGGDGFSKNFSLLYGRRTDAKRATVGAPDEAIEGAELTANELVLPALKYLTVHHLVTRIGMTSRRELEESWEELLRVLEQRKLARRPLRCLRLVASHRFGENTVYGTREMEELKTIDDRMLCKAAELVGKIIDSRQHLYNPAEWPVDDDEE